MVTLAQARDWMVDFRVQVVEHEDMLTELDREVGDADHGSNLARGMNAVAALDIAAFGDTSAYLKKAGMTLVSTVGGASGPLYGTFLLRLAGAIDQGLAAAFRAGLDGVIMRGKAEPGDKTMVDVLVPAVKALEASDDAAGLQAAASAAADARDAIIPLVARKGRASYLGERSAGHGDPGATSMVMLLEAAARTLA